MKIVYPFLLLILVSLCGCNPVCDDTLNNTINYFIVTPDTSNPIVRVSQYYNQLQKTTYENAIGNDTIVWSIAIDKPNTSIVIERKNRIDTLFYTINVKKRFDPESECADNNIVYETDSITISRHTFNTISIIDRYEYVFLGGRYLQARYLKID